MMMMRRNRKNKKKEKEKEEKEEERRRWRMKGEEGKQNKMEEHDLIVAKQTSREYMTEQR